MPTQATKCCEHLSAHRFEQDPPVLGESMDPDPAALCKVLLVASVR